MGAAEARDTEDFSYPAGGERARGAPEPQVTPDRDPSIAISCYEARPSAVARDGMETGDCVLGERRLP